jgi:hypothetical protein
MMNPLYPCQLGALVPVDLRQLQEMGGWETAAMVRRYAHLASHHLAPYAAKLDMDRLTLEQAGVMLATMKPADMDEAVYGTNTAQDAAE